MHRDPPFLDEATRLKIDISPISGDEVLQAIDGIADAPPDLLDTMKRLLETKGGG